MLTPADVLPTFPDTRCYLLTLAVTSWDALTLADLMTPADTCCHLLTLAAEQDGQEVDRVERALKELALARRRPQPHHVLEREPRDAGGLEVRKVLVVGQLTVLVAALQRRGQGQGLWSRSKVRGRLSRPCSDGSVLSVRPIVDATTKRIEIVARTCTTPEQLKSINWKSTDMQASFHMPL